MRFSKLLKNFIESKIINVFITFVILINAVTLGLETSEKLVSKIGNILTYIDKIALSIFVVELIIKLFVYRLSFFKSGWNVFDFIIVTIALIPSSGPLSILRAFRIFRALRLLSMIPSMKKVIQAMFYAIPGIASVGTIILLIFYISAVLVTNFFGNKFENWFGTIGDSMYSLFQIMTLESWSMGIVRPVMEEYPYAWAFFVPFILITTFAVLNLFIGIIVDAMQHQTIEDESKDNQKSQLNLEKKVLSIENELKEIKEILISPSIQKLRMLEEINVLKNLFTEDKNLASMSRRLTLIQAPLDIELEKCDEEFSVTVFLTEKGWIRAVEGHNVDENAIKLKDQDKLLCTAKITTEKKLLIFTNIGKVYSIHANKLKIKNNDFEPIRKYLNLTQDEYILHVNEYSSDGPDLILISKKGKGMISKQKEMLTSTRNGKVVMNLARGVSVCAVRQVSGSHIAVINDSGNLLVFSHEDIKRLSRGSGIIFQNLKDGTIIDITSANPNEVINLVNKNTSRSIIRIDTSDYLGERGRIGKSLKLRNSSNIPLLRFSK